MVSGLRSSCDPSAVQPSLDRMETVAETAQTPRKRDGKDEPEGSLVTYPRATLYPDPVRNLFNSFCIAQSYAQRPCITQRRKVPGPASRSNLNGPAPTPAQALKLHAAVLLLRPSTNNSAILLIGASEYRAHALACTRTSPGRR